MLDALFDWLITSLSWRAMLAIVLIALCLIALVWAAS
jgi:hypothetical protein